MQRQLRIADLVVSIDSDGRPWEFQPDSPNRLFEVRSQSEDVHVTVHWQPLGRENLGEEVFSLSNAEPGLPPKLRMYRDKLDFWNLVVYTGGYPAFVREGSQLQSRFLSGGSVCRVGTNRLADLSLSSDYPSRSCVLCQPHGASLWNLASCMRGDQGWGRLCIRRGVGRGKDDACQALVGIQGCDCSGRRVPGLAGKGLRFLGVRNTMDWRIQVCFPLGCAHRRYLLHSPRCSKRHLAAPCRAGGGAATDQIVPGVVRSSIRIQGARFLPRPGDQSAHV